MSSIGQLRKRITISSVGGTLTDDIGGQIATKNQEIIAWAKVTELTGTRALELNTISNKQPLEIRFRTSAYDLSANDLISYEGSDITIHAVTKDPLKRMTTVIGWL